MKIIVIISLFVMMQFSVKASEEDELKQLIISLNSHVVNLEKRVKELEQLVKVKNINVYNSKATWRKLKKKMSTAQVRRLLGEPLNIVVGVYTYWYYNKDQYQSYVRFDYEVLDNWKEPKN